MADDLHTSGDYKQQVIATVNEIYPKYIQKEILAKLDKLDLVKLKKNQATKPSDAVDLTDVQEDDQLIRGLESDNVLKEIEKREFFKSYHFAAIFNATPKDDNIFTELEKSTKVVNFKSPDYKHDAIFDNQLESAKTIPTRLGIGNVSLLKFSKLLTGYTQTGEKRQIKYNVLGVYFSHLGVLEIRFDKVRNIFQQEDELFYHNQVEFVVKWFREVAKFELENINLAAIINFINKKDQDEVIIHSQAMSMSTGAKAELYTGQTGNSVLPLLGELKELIRLHEDLFEESPKIKDILDKFIAETESTSDLPWISLRWKGDDKNEGTVVKFRHNYENKGYTLLSYYGRQTIMEKMDYVTKYIIDNRKELERIESDIAEEIGETARDNPAV
ncbi:hypothetical protein [Paenibacillus sp. RC84]|uniref:hypothetical protein n=1 Tax=Paenibacillus sp. RC84 TaxID=3156252 RepID=UPI003515CDF6